MPLPFILGGLAVASVATGIKKGYDGYQDKSLADDILVQAKNTYESAQKKVDYTQKENVEQLESLGDLYLKIGQDFHEFRTLAEKFIDQIEKYEGRHLEVKLPKLSMAKIESLALNSVAFAGKMAGGAVGGAAAAYAVYGGVMAFAAASTGTPIATLSGVAAYNATLAAIGGGSIASGGFGMAVGAKILGGVVAAPVALVAGLAYASYGADALENAKKCRNQAEEYEKTAKITCNTLLETNRYINRVRNQVQLIYSQFQTYFEDLKIVETMVRRGNQSELANQSNVLRMIENGYALAAILTDIITTPLFKVKKDGMDNSVLLDENNAPILLQDKLGLNIPNQAEMNEVLNASEIKSIRIVS